MRHPIRGYIGMKIEKHVWIIIAIAYDWIKATSITITQIKATWKGKEIKIITIKLEHHLISFYPSLKNIVAFICMWTTEKPAV